MSEHAGEKTEQASPKRLEEAYKKGQFARSAGGADGFCADGGDDCA